MYSMLTPNRRHQGKHKAGAYACPAAGCDYTFHSATLLERHRRHDSSFPFQLPEAYFFRCPSSSQAFSPTDTGSPSLSDSHSARATPLASSQNGEATGSERYGSYSPTPSQEALVSTSEASVNGQEAPTRAQHLRVPSRSPMNNTRRKPTQRPLPRNVTSSPAVLQDNRYNQEMVLAHNFAFPPTGYQHNFVEHGFSPHSPQTGYRAEDDLSGQSFYRQTHEQSQIAPISEMSSIAAQVPTWQAPRHSVPTSLGSDTPLACWIGSSTYNHDAAPTYVYGRHSSHPTMSSESHVLNQHFPQQSMNRFLQNQTQWHAHNQQYQYPPQHSGSYSEERTRRNSVSPRHSTGNLDPGLNPYTSTTSGH
ncbi:hypothetical protein D6C89_03112 [Aureobasidium pullulans]|nr:hypothetical protein D6C89_03112 [Aureobasidium pullulans]